MWGPNIFSISKTDLGPCIWTGDTSISWISTSNLPEELTPCAQSRRSESEILNQNSSSATRRSTGSLITPPY